MFVVDTNVLVHAVDRGSPFHPPCSETVEEAMASNGGWYSTWGIVYEFLRVTTHPRVLRRPLTTAEGMSVIDARGTTAPGSGLTVIE